jgi:CRP/FNR family transcriptional regulator, cyclic AMP receptor protein
MAKRKFLSGEYIFRQGDDSDLAFVIESGFVDIIKEDAGGSVILTQLGAGDIFGEMGLIDEKPRSASARALSPQVEVIAVSHDEFVHMLFNKQEKGILIIQSFFERIRELTARVSNNPETPSQTKSKIADLSSAEVTLKPSTDCVSTRIPKNGLLVKKFPFRIGRQPVAGETSIFDMNDLLLEDSKPLHLSRNHLSINRERHNFIVLDRGSYHGTIVNGNPIGGKRKRAKYILDKHKNQLILGDKSSPFRFSIIIDHLQ